MKTEQENNDNKDSANIEDENLINKNDKKDETNIENKPDNKEPEKIEDKKDETLIDTEELETKEDNTVANIQIPKTGENDLIFPIILLLTIRAIIYYIKLIKIKGKIQKR